MRNSIDANGGEESRDMKESQRALELRKFFAPYQQSSTAAFDEGFNESLNNDGALDAYSESLVWRLKGVHAMVSLVDRGTQYFLAGAVRTKARDDADISDVITTGEWFGCSNLPTPGGLCENTLALDPSESEYPCFIVNDLSKDPRFASLPVVDGKITSYRFYAGTPITTDHGVNIGSFFLFDDQPRDGMTLEQRKFLHQQAGNVMKHLETKREAAERRRVALMSKGIAKFLERTSQDTLHEDDLEPQQDKPRAKQERVDSNGSTTSQSNGSAIEKESVLDKIRYTLDQAAQILKDSLELNAGGVVFLDTAIGYSDTGNTEAYLDSTTDIGSQVEVEKQEEKRRKESRESGTRPSLRPVDKAGQEVSQESTRTYGDEHKAAKVLAMSAAREATWDQNANVLDAKTLQSLINVYPKGNVWYTDEEGFFSSLEQMNKVLESPSTSPSERRKSVDPTHQKAEATMLARIFQGARQIIFLPLWDAGGNRWFAGCFVWSRSAVPVFTVDSEAAYLSAFTNSVMVEISRLDAITSNKMKSDFISSISHEFRSPLHGILASAELLRDSSLDASQMECIATIQNCSGTLLDTINHVLDYSKINSFEKKGNQKGTISNELIQVTNLALLCEDIMNGMIAAREFRGLATDDPVSTISDDFKVGQSLQNEKDRLPVLAMILDIENRDWYYNIQAGALRRVVMNIVGNAQKYTVSGYIMVQMRIQEKVHSRSKSPEHILFLKIRDSGRGMSTEYMERKLYHPFAQEDSFAAGVGLGLSIVRSIVNQLGGQISIRSQLGKGTDVEITIPMNKAEAPAPQNPDLSSTKDILLDAQNCITQLQSRALGKSIHFSRTDETPSHPKDISWTCILKYCTDWFGFTISSSPSSSDITVTDHSSSTGYEAGQRVLVVHSDMLNTSKHVGRYRDCAIGNIYPPFGPFRLARCLLSLLDTNLSRSEEYGSSSYMGLADRATQTPLGSPEERIVLDGIILTDYGFTSTQSSLSNTTVSTDIDDGESKIGVGTGTVQGDDDDQMTPATIGIAQLTLDQTTSSPRNQQPMTTPPSSFGKLVLPQQKPTISQLTTSTPTPKPLQILAVDDNALNLQLLHRYLLKRSTASTSTTPSPTNHKSSSPCSPPHSSEDIITLARDGLEAVNAVKTAGPEHPFDVIFMDISMPKMNGFEATRAIRALERRFSRRSANRSVPTSLQRQGSSVDSVESEPNLEINNTVASSNGTGVHDQGQEGPNQAVHSGMHPEEESTEAGTAKRAYIIALTGLGSKRDREEAEGSGFDDFLTKPISFKRIGEVLGSLRALKNSEEVKDMLGEMEGEGEGEGYGRG